MSLQFGDLVLVLMRFHQASDAKVRPAVVLLDSGDDDFVAAPITSLFRASGYEMAIERRQQAGLNVASYVRVQKLTVLPRADVLRNLGRLSGPDRTRLADIACRTFCPGN